MHDKRRTYGGASKISKENTNNGKSISPEECTTVAPTLATAMATTICQAKVAIGGAVVKTPRAATALTSILVTNVSESTATPTAVVADPLLFVKPLKESSSSCLTVPYAPPSNYTNRRSWITTERINELRRKAQEAVKQNKTFTIRGSFNSVRNALTARGWVEKLDVHRKQVPSGVCQVTYDDLAQRLPKRKPNETRAQYIAKCERNIMSRFLEHMPIDFLWTNRKEKCDYIDQAKNPVMTINKFHRAPFTSKEGLCSQLRDFHWFYEEGIAEMYFPRCFNVWSPEELGEFVDNFKLTACIAFIRALVEKFRDGGFDAIFSPTGTVPFNSIDFAYKRCTEYMDNCHHNDIDLEDPPRIWEHDWDAFLCQQFRMANEEAKICADPQRIVEHIVRNGAQLLETIRCYWPQYSLDGYQNLWIVKPANKCRGRGIQLMDNLKKIMTVVNPSIASKSRYVVQKYIERPLIIHHTKFDIRQWFLITNVQPLVVWMYKESYLRFSSQEYSLANHHESVHLTNHAIQKKYSNGKRDKRLPNENMWDCYSFQAYLRQIGKQDMWLERIYPGMRKAIVGTMLASQENMDRRPNTFELFGADFMICADFYPWLIEINSSPDLGATTSVTARMCPQCLEDVVKVVIDRRMDPKADLGNFELIYRQVVPPTPAYMGLNLFVKGKQIMSKVNQGHGFYYHRKERSLNTSNFFRQRTALIPSISNVHKAMPTFNATDYMEKCIMAEAATNSSRSSIGSCAGSVLNQQLSPLSSSVCNLACQKILLTAPTSPCPNLLRTPQAHVGMRIRSFTNLTRASVGALKATPELAQENTVIPTKRHRSCGPRLNAAVIASNAPGEKKFKFIIKKCTIQKNIGPLGSGYFAKQQPMSETATVGSALDYLGPPATSKSEDNIVELLYGQHNAKDLLRRENNRQSPRMPTRQKSLALHQSEGCLVERKHCRRIPAIGSGNSLADRKWRSLRDAYIRPKTTGYKVPPAIAANCATNEGENPANIHAIGKSIATWKSTRRSATRRLATAPVNKSSNIYVCHNKSSIVTNSDLAKLKRCELAMHRARRRYSGNGDSVAADDLIPPPTRNSKC